jgi:hypothetical protein
VSLKGDFVEIELSLGKNSYWREMAAAILVVSLFGLGWLGWIVTRAGTEGHAQVLTWADYQLGKAEKAYQTERETLRDDANTLTGLLSQPTSPSPVAVQVTANRILEHTSNGVTELTDARTTLGSAAIAVRDWAVGTVDKNAAIQAVQSAISLLSE